MQINQYFIDINDDNAEQKSLDFLIENGYVIIRNLVNKKIIDRIYKNALKVLSSPNVLGSVGYYQKDPFKKLYDGFLLGHDVIKLVASNFILNLIERYVKGNILINEIFLKNDLGFDEVYFPYHRHTGIDVENSHIKRPWGCGLMVYLHDTDEGAFCYSKGSHKLDIHENTSLISQHKNSEDLKKKLLRISGKSGDVIIFDETGFHGPEQPTSKERIALLSGYQLFEATNGKTRTQIPVLLSDLRDLTDRQLKCLGLGSKYRTPFENYHLRSGFPQIKKRLSKKINLEIKNFIFFKKIKKFINLIKF